MYILLVTWPEHIGDVIVCTNASKGSLHGGTETNSFNLSALGSNTTFDLSIELRKNSHVTTKRLLHGQLPQFHDQKRRIHLRKYRRLVFTLLTDIYCTGEPSMASRKGLSRSPNESIRI